MGRAADGSPDLAWLDQYVRRLIERSAPIQFTVANSAGEREAIWRLRGQTVIDHGWKRADELQDGLEYDDHDAYASLVGAWHGDILAGAARVTYPVPGRLLPTEEALGRHVEPVGRIVNFDRFVVAPGYSQHGHHVLNGLYSQCWLDARSHGFDLMAGVSSPAVIRLCAQIVLRFTPLGPPRHYWGEERVPWMFDPRKCIDARFLRLAASTPAARASET
jgi:hypothetical protein